MPAKEMARLRILSILVVAWVAFGCGRAEGPAAPQTDATATSPETSANDSLKNVSYDAFIYAYPIDPPQSSYHFQC